MRPDHPSRKWKQQDIELFTVLWNEDATVEFMMQAFGVTRSAILGLRYRLNLKKRIDRPKLDRHKQQFFDRLKWKDR